MKRVNYYFAFAVIAAFFPHLIYSQGIEPTETKYYYNTKPRNGFHTLRRKLTPRRLQELGGGTVPDEWTCPEFYYGTNDGCDCNCGAVDPDCWRSNHQILYGCLASNLFSSSCSSTGDCEYTPGNSWTCEVELFGNGDGCHCGCGQEDPDCIYQSSSVGVIGCDTDELVYVSSSCRSGTCHYSNQTGSSSRKDECSSFACGTPALYVAFFVGFLAVIGLSVVYFVRYISKGKLRNQNAVSHYVDGDGIRTPMEADRVVSLAHSIDRDSYRTSFEEEEYEGKTFEEVRLELEVAKHWGERDIDTPPTL